MTRSPAAMRQHDQSGAVVVEFAIVFVLFITLLWGLISYGAIFAVQQSLSHAAAEGARAGVDVPDPTDAEGLAAAAVTDQLGWLDDAGVTTAATVEPCDAAVYGAGHDCLVVTVTYDWQDHAIVPKLVDVAVPSELSSRAVVVFD